MVEGLQEATKEVVVWQEEGRLFGGEVHSAIQAVGIQPIFQSPLDLFDVFFGASDVLSFYLDAVCSLRLSVGRDILEPNGQASADKPAVPLIERNTKGGPEGGVETPGLWGSGTGQQVVDVNVLLDMGRYCRHDKPVVDPLVDADPIWQVFSDEHCEACRLPPGQFGDFALIGVPQLAQENWRSVLVPVFVDQLSDTVREFRRVHQAASRHLRAESVPCGRHRR